MADSAPALRDRIGGRVHTHRIAGGAHADPEAAIATVGDVLEEELTALEGLSAQDLKARRAERFYAIGRSGL